MQIAQSSADRIFHIQAEAAGSTVLVLKMSPFAKRDGLTGNFLSPSEEALKHLSAPQFFPFANPRESC